MILWEPDRHIEVMELLGIVKAGLVESLSKAVLLERQQMDPRA